MKEAKRLAKPLPQLISERNKKKQEVASLSVDQGVVTELSRSYQGRENFLTSCMPLIGLPYPTLQATFSIWAEMPKGDTSVASFTREILHERGVIIAPDKKFSTAGENFIQSRIMVNSEWLREAVRQAQ
jgi:hypothetical protein